MDYAQALKKVQSRKPKGNYLLFTLDYNTKVVLPYADGLALIASLNNAEQLNDPYNAQHSITELDKGKLNFTNLSQDEYEHYKVAALLGITVAEAKEQRLTIT